LSAVPDGEWFCVNCTRDPGAPIGIYPLRKAKPKVVKPKAAAAPPRETKKRAPSPMEEDYDDEEEETGGKRKAAGRTRGGTCFFVFFSFMRFFRGVRVLIGICSFCSCEEKEAVIGILLTI
jgi:hypothetical protein